MALYNNILYNSTKYNTTVHNGIVLKKYYDSSKITLLDDTYGRMNVIISNKSSFSVGAVLRYSLDGQRYQRMLGGTYLVDSYECVLLPKKMDPRNLFFLHHVIELCFYSVPLGALDTHIFGMIITLYENSSFGWSPNVQKIFTMHLLLTLGFAVEHPLLKNSAVIQLCTMPIDKIFESAIELDGIDPELVRDIDAWIRLCLVQHPHSNHFKTTRFIYTE